MQRAILSQKIPPSGGASMFLATYNRRIRILPAVQELVVLWQTLIRPWQFGLQPVLVRSEQIRIVKARGMR